MSVRAIIIPVHNRRDVTLGCLRHLRAIGDLTRYRVVVIDDGSTDGTADAVRGEFPSVEIVAGDGELWWTGAIALGMQRAFESGAEAVCWLNDDCRPEPGTLAGLFEQVTHAPGAVVSAGCFDATTGAPVPLGFAARRTFAATGSTMIDVEGLSGFCVAVPAAVWERLGAPDARRFPHYFGDNAYTLLAHRAGFRVRIASGLRAELADTATPDGEGAQQARGHERFARHFLSRKSPHEIRAVIAFQRLKYGPIRGSVLAAAKVLQNLWQFLIPRRR